MNLGNLKPAAGSNKKRKRVGRGPASGTGGTAGRGHKGQKARSGGSYRPWFEGGQMPLQRRVPKRGFTNIHAKPVEVVNVGSLAGLGGEPITPETLRHRGLLRDKDALVKILGQGDLGEAVTVHAHSFSAQARQKIEVAGGRAELIVQPKRPKRYKKKERPKKA
jgi:large subunit ribosomal protein L15